MYPEYPNPVSGTVTLNFNGTDSSLDVLTASSAICQSLVALYLLKLICLNTPETSPLSFVVVFTANFDASNLILNFLFSNSL